MAQLRERFKSIPYFSFGLKERTTHSLAISIAQLRRRIDFSASEGARERGSFSSEELLNQASDGEIPFGASDDQLPKIQSSTLRWIAYEEERLKEADRMAYAETCSPRTVAQLIVDPNTKIVEALSMDDCCIFYPY